jgi:hypothetical protein
LLFERLPQFLRIVEREMAGGALHVTVSDRLHRSMTNIPVQVTVASGRTVRMAAEDKMRRVAGDR